MRVSYKIGLDGVVNVELGRLLHSIEARVNGFGIHAQTADTTASTIASGSKAPDSVKGGHDFVIVVVVAIVAGAVAGFVAGKCAAKRVLASVKGGHD